MGSPRRLVMLAAVIILAVSCGRFVRHGEARPTRETGSVGEAFRTSTPSPTSAVPQERVDGATAAPSSVLVVTLTDQNGRHPAGIPVRFRSGGRENTAVTDTKGQVRTPGPGRFRIDVMQGCHSRVRVTGGGFANVGAPPHGVKPVELPVEWQHRHTPAPPIQPDRTGNWPVGANTRIRFLVIDRCEQDKAPGAAYPTFRFRTNETVDVVGTPNLKADADGYGFVTVRCVRDGEPSVVAYDSANPPDAFDLIDETVGFAEPHCGN